MVKSLAEVYCWEMETIEGQVFSQYDEKGNERSSKVILPEKVIRVSLIPRFPILPRHDVLIQHSKGERFIERRGRGFLKPINGNYSLTEYVHCITTNKYRLWVFSTKGSCKITSNDFELYL